MRIKNGGVELGILQFIEDSGIKLSNSDQQRKEYLESLPNDKYIELDDNGLAMSDEQAKAKLKSKISKFKFKP